MRAKPGIKNLTTQVRNNIQFNDIFDLADIQRLQDLFSDSSGVASVITHPDGTPITHISNSCRLCNDIIRKTEKGRANCIQSDAMIGRQNPSGPVVQPCLSGGLCAGARITVGGKHIANWLIGPVRNEEVDEFLMLQYADEIGVNREDFRKALNEVTVMSVEQFNKVAKMLFAFANELSKKAYNNLQLKMQITEREQAEEALRESEEWFRMLADTISTGIFIYQKERIVFVNHASRKLSGYTEEEALSLPFWKFIHPDYRELVRERGLARQRGEPVPVRYEVKIVRKDGEDRWIDFTAEKIDWQGQPAILGSANDITGRKLAEELLWESEEELKDANAKLTCAQRIAHIGSWNDYLPTNQLTWSEEMYHILGFSPNIPMKLEEVTGVFPPEESERFRKAVDAAINADVPYSIDYKIIRPDGAVRYIHDEGEVVRDEQGKAIWMHGTTQDITERKQAEEAVRYQNEMRQTILDNIPVMVASFDREGHYRFINHCWQSTLGWSFEEAINKDILAEIYPEPEYREYVVNYIRRAAGSWGDFKTRTRDGRILDTSWINVPLSDGSSIGIGLDITGRKHMEDALLLEKENFRSSLDDSPLGIRIVSAEGNTIYANHTILNFYGYESLGELQKTPLKKRYTPESYAEAQKRKHQRESGDFNATNYEISIVRKNGEIRHLRVFRKEVLWDGVRHFQIIYDDITDRRQAHEKIRNEQLLLRTLIDNLPDLIYCKDLACRKTLVNLAEVRFTGAKSETEVLGKDDFEFYPKEIAERFFADDQFVMQTGKPVLNREEFILDEKGNKRWLLTSKLPLRDKDNQIIGLVGIGRDITGHKQAEEEITLKNEELKKVIAEKDKFFSIIAHDLRSPFNSLLGLTQIMANELPGLKMEEIQEIAESMRNSATNLFHLLENLLQWARIKQGLISFNPEVVQLLPIVNESIAMEQESAKKKGIDITHDIPDDLDVFADKNMLQTVIRNLVSNAVKFTCKRGKVSLSAKTTDDKNVEISIEDTGIGMSRAIVDNLFRTDVQTSRKGTEGEPSSGLGLLLCKEFIEKHGGKIWIKSDPKSTSGVKGSVFYFTIPYNPAV